MITCNLTLGSIAFIRFEPGCEGPKPRRQSHDPPPDFLVKDCLEGAAGGEDDGEARGEELLLGDGDPALAPLLAVLLAGKQQPGFLLRAIYDIFCLAF